MVEQQVVVRLVADRLVVVPNCLLVFLLGPPQVAAGVEDPRWSHRMAVRVEADGLIIVVDGLIVLPLSSPDATTSPVGDSELWIKLDCLREVLEGPIGFAIQCPRCSPT